jgi:hypothetical protein
MHKYIAYLTRNGDRIDQADVDISIKEDSDGNYTFAINTVLLLLVKDDVLQLHIEPVDDAPEIIVKRVTMNIGKKETHI